MLSPRSSGSAPLARIDRSDVLTLRQWWITRLQAENLRADTVNRCFSDITGMLSVVDAALHTSFRDVWAGVRLRETNKTRTGRRAPYPVDFIRDRVLAPGALDGLNSEARATVLLIIETGARPSELCNLRPEDFALDAGVPHIAITERGDRRVKTSHSLRTIPLVGCALAGARLVAATGFVRYADKEDTLSNTINAYLEENGLRPTPLHTLYSFRHTFQDRLTAADVIDRMQTALMGHAFDRPTYGDGPTLEQKLKVLEQIRIS